MSFAQDPYIWMEDLYSPKVLDWVRKRNEKSRIFLSECSNNLSKRLEKYFNVPVISKIIIGKDGYYALLRDASSFKIVRLNDKGEEVIISSLELGKDAVIKNLEADWREDLIIFSYSIGGSDYGYAIFMRPSNREIIDKIEGIIGSVVWLGDNKYYYVRVYYNQKTPDGVDPPATRVFLRENGDEEMILGEKLPSLYFIGLKKSVDSSKLFITLSYGWTQTEVYVSNLKHPEQSVFLYGGKDILSYPIDYVQNKYLLIAFDDVDGMGRILSIDENGSIKEIVKPWRYPIQDAVMVKESLIVHYLVDAVSHIRVFDLNGSLYQEYSFEPKGSISSLESNDEVCIFKYESIAIPYRIYLYRDAKIYLLRSVELNENYVIEESWVRSNDDTPIHFFRVRNRKVKNLNVMLIYGYGGYGISMVPRFTPYVLPLLDDGFEYIIANIRGGGEYGEKWHREGMREKKQNVFNDFIAILAYFKSEGKKIFAYGVSNGGLLVGAVLTQRPELLDGAIIGYPVLDMLRFNKLSIGRVWVTEFGDPENPKDREFLMRYSPYHNLRHGVEYPSIMLITGLKDDRVHPSHALKFAAKLEEIGAYYVLRVETESGHSGASPSRKISEYADILAFIYKCLNIC